MKYNDEDFTEKEYRNLLNIAKNRYKFISFNEIKNHDSFVLWRHDIDISVQRALKLAEIENTVDVKATYFIQLGSEFYNIFEQDIKNKIIDIIQLGHSIGLHFDATQYNIKAKSDLEKYLFFEKNTLEQLLDIEISVFSFHNPTDEILKYDEWQYSNMINTYAKYFKDNVGYCSDSNGYWRYKRLEDFLKENNNKIQVLTHPNWWQKEIMLPREKVIRAITQRKNNTLINYDKLLEFHKRVNIGK